MKTTTASLLFAAAAALPLSAQERQTIEAAWSEGKVAIDYGAPEWRAEFDGAMAKQASWRLGKDAPTRIDLSCGLLTIDGCVPAGQYGLAMKKNAKGAWDLVVYPGEGFYDAEREGWRIRPTTVEQTDTIASELSIALNDDKELEVCFGPHRAVYPFTPIELFEPVETEFARIPAKLEVMAVPVDGAVKNLTVGKATIERDGVAVAWTLELTLDGDEPVLSFVNDRADALAGDKQRVDSMIERVSSMLDEATEETKGRFEAFLQQQQELKKKLAVEEQMLERFEAKKSVGGELEQLADAVKNLTFESERIEGGIILKFGAGDRVATFKVVPRDFVIRRR